MNKDCPEIIAIRAKIETSLQRKMKTPSDFDFLSGAIWERIHEYISPTTLKRTWGYITGALTIRYSTLNILVKFVGYRDFDDFLAEFNHLSDSNFVDTLTLDARKLRVGQAIEVLWQPNRRCVFRHLGDCHFEVAEAENSKLKIGDTFDAVFFVQGEPLYIDNLCQGQKCVSYLCGNKNGLTKVSLLSDMPYLGSKTCTDSY